MVFNPTTGTVTYGGVPLTFPTAEVLAWIEDTISFRDVVEFAYPSWPGKGRTAWPWPLWWMDRPPAIGRLVWPVGASRWGYGHFLATDSQLTQIRPQVYYANRYSPLPLVLDDGNGRPVSTNMYLLPAKPLMQGTGDTELYILTLVDPRYFWWEVAAAVPFQVPYAWSTLLALVTASLGINLIPDAIAPAYMLADTSLSSNYEFLPMLLDAVLQNIGHRLVAPMTTNPLPTYRTHTARSAIKSQKDQYDALVTTNRFPVKLAGGVLRLNPAAAPTDLIAVTPDTVLVRFPDYTQGFGFFFVQTVDLNTFGLPEYPLPQTGHEGVKVFHDTAAFDGTNAIALNLLAQQIAQDFWLWKLSRLDVTFGGAIPWIPEGMDDIIWDWRGDKTMQTRVCGGNINNICEELNHFVPTGSSSGSSGSPAAFGPGVKLTFLVDVNSVCVNGVIITTKSFACVTLPGGTLIVPGIC
jgi:hypothetical protein